MSIIHSKYVMKRLCMENIHFLFHHHFKILLIFLIRKVFTHLLKPLKNHTTTVTYCQFPELHSSDETYHIEWLIRQWLSFTEVFSGVSLLLRWTGWIPMPVVSYFTVQTHLSSKHSIQNHTSLCTATQMVGRTQTSLKIPVLCNLYTQYGPWTPHPKTLTEQARFPKNTPCNETLL